MKLSDIILVFFLVATVCMTFYFLPPMNSVQYNCTWAEISPDIPIKVKEACRRRNAENAQQGFKDANK